MDSWSPLVVALAAALGMMTLVWVASLVKRDASIVDLLPLVPGPGRGIVKAMPPRSGA